MYKVHEFKYTPLLTGVEQRYTIELPPERVPLVYKTMTSDMYCWDGELVKSLPGYAAAVVRHGNELVELSGRLHGKLKLGQPCFVMEHLDLEGDLEYLIATHRLDDVRVNYVNFGIPNFKHVRIDIYTGESRVIE